MSLAARIRTDLRTAMKERDNLRTQTLRTLIAALKEKEIQMRQEGTGLSVDDEVRVLMNAAKKRRESITLYVQGNRQDLADQESKELGIIESYLPRMMTEAEVMAEVDKVLDETGETDSADFGRIMGRVMRELKGKADGKLVQETVRRRIDSRKR